MANTPISWTERAETFETPWQACGWSRQSQKERFERTLAALEPKAGETLLDFGCGTGELTNYLPAKVNYVGVDWAPGMLRRARQEHPKFTFQDVIPEGFVNLSVAAGDVQSGVELVEGSDVGSARDAVGTHHSRARCRVERVA